jgi:hypothetical protein
MIDFSIPRRCVYRRFIDRPGPCPHCGGTLQQSAQTYLVATRQGARITDMLVVGNDMGWFCAACPTVIINVEEMDVAFAYPKSDWDLGEEAAVLGIVDLDAIPPQQAHLPLGEIDPLPLVWFDVASGRKRPSRSAHRRTTRARRSKAGGKSKKKRRRR